MIFTCEDCQYRTVDEGKQIGCQLGLADKIGFKDGDTNYVLDNICVSKNKSEEERRVRLGYIFIIPNLCDNSIAKLAYNVSLIKSKNPLWIGVSVNNGADVSAIKNILEGIDTTYNIIENYDEIYDKHKIDQFIKYLKHGWTYVNIIGEYFNHNAKEVLDKAIFNDCKRFVIVKNSEDDNVYDINNTCFYNMIYRYLKGSLPIDEEQPRALWPTFENKVESQNPEFVLRWKDIK